MTWQKNPKTYGWLFLLMLILLDVSWLFLNNPSFQAVWSLTWYNTGPIPIRSRPLTSTFNLTGPRNQVLWVIVWLINVTPLKKKKKKAQRLQCVLVCLLCGLKAFFFRLSANEAEVTTEHSSYLKPNQNNVKKKNKTYQLYNVLPLDNHIVEPHHLRRWH